MLDTDTFLTILYVIADDFCKTLEAQAPQPGPAPALSRSEVLTLALFAQWQQFPSERAFARYAQRHLRAAFPTLPDRSQLNRQMRQQHDALAAFCLFLAERTGARSCAYEVLDSTAARMRNVKRRGQGWFPGQANIGWSNRLGWYEGFHVLLAVTPEGVITGFGFAPASVNDRLLAETFFALRQRPDARLVSVGQPAHGWYIADSNFSGAKQIERWAAQYGAWVVAIPQRRLHDPAWQPWKRRLISLRQIIESVNNMLLTTLGLDDDRPHTMTGFQARLAAKAALHNLCFWLNRQLGRAPLAFADLVSW